jgi:hypothetical protein
MLLFTVDKRDARERLIGILCAQSGLARHVIATKRNTVLEVQLLSNRKGQ